ncbi:MAG: hypothetical protein KDC34_08135 [Saprospiraceae bacterium]|nr:hypothetical protein [Saprospiraceae bacterium]
MNKSEYKFALIFAYRLQFHFSTYIIEQSTYSKTIIVYHEGDALFLYLTYPDLFIPAFSFFIEFSKNLSFTTNALQELPR